MIANYFLNLVKVVVTQMAGVLGIFFVIGYILCATTAITHKLYYRVLGWPGVLWTAWIGTPIHEIGHIFFVKIFRHRITSISLFRPRERTGRLGHVEHSFSEKSLYQKLGNFFIGAAPLIFGSLFLSAMLYYLVPNGREVLSSFTRLSQNISAAPSILLNSLKLLFAPANITAWNFWLFIYMSVCVASHLAPSREDLSSMWRGFFWLATLVVILNAVTLLFGYDMTAIILNSNRYLKLLTGIFIYALFLAVMHLILAFIILGPFRKRG